MNNIVGFPVRAPNGGFGQLSKRQVQLLGKVAQVMLDRENNSHYRTLYDAVVDKWLVCTGSSEDFLAIKLAEDELDRLLLKLIEMLK
jgi:hypothetical protein